MKAAWNKQCRYNGPDCWRYSSPDPESYPAIAIVKQHERVIAKIWGPINISDQTLHELVQNEYTDSCEVTIERIAGRRVTVN